MLAVAVAYLLANLAHGKACLPQQVLGLVNADAGQVFRKPLPRLFLEEGAKIADAETYCLTDLL